MFMHGAFNEPGLSTDGPGMNGTDMKIFVPFSEELFETAGRQARRPGAVRLPDGAQASMAGPPSDAADAPMAHDDDSLGELVPFRLDYRCLRLKARPREHAPRA